MVKMENNRKSQDKKEGKNKKKKERSRYESLILTLKLSFIEFDHLGWCWIYGFGFDKYGNLYQRKKIEDV